MKGRQILNERMLAQFENYMREEEKSRATIEKYLRDVRVFMKFAGDRGVDKTLAMEYKAWLSEKYAVTSANSMIAALNSFFHFQGWTACCVRQFKVQRQAYCSAEKELSKDEYIRLVNAAKSRGSERLSLLLETICGTGIRVSELIYITVEAARQGETTVSCKGKIRTVFLPGRLRKKLLAYAKKHRIAAGPVFITRTGRPLNRCCVWREMKALCALAEVAPAKVFPHNLRHLFARTFYRIEHDIAKLADILGHSSINTTRIYMITSGEEHRRKIERMQLVL